MEQMAQDLLAVAETSITKYINGLNASVPEDDELDEEGTDINLDEKLTAIRKEEESESPEADFDREPSQSPSESPSAPADEPIVDAKTVCRDRYTDAENKVRDALFARRTPAKDVKLGIKADFEDDDITRIMSPKVLDDDFIDDRKMFTHLAANKSPVRSGIVPSRVLVQRELAGLDLTDVTTLDLESKGLRNFPREVLDLDNLEELVLESNEIEDNLPDDLPRLAKLRILNLRSFASYDNSPTLPESFGEMKALTHLNLHYNHVTLPRSIAKLDSLESLRMPIFEGMTVPETFGDIPNLQSLQVWAYDGYPAASEFPLFPLSLKSLRHLEVSSISAPSIPEAITTLTELESLEFGGVRNLTSFPDLSSLSTLRKLRFDGYGSSNFALLDSIMHLVWLEDLDLGRWHMPTLPEGLAQFKNLKRLDLSFNELKAVPQWLLDLDLEFLDISSNELDASASKALQEAHPNADLRL